MIYRFFDARDAILKADKILTGGENGCELWSGFAERGLVSSPTCIRLFFQCLLV